LNSINKKSLDHLHIFLCADDNFKLGVFLTVSSFIEHLNSNQKTTIHMLSNSFSKESVNCINRIIEENKKPVSFELSAIDFNLFEAVNQNNQHEGAHIFPVETYGRILIPIMFPDITFGVYLDSDMFVQKDLSLLAEYQDTDIPVYAVKDLATETLSHKNDWLNCAALGINPKAGYFNSGFLVMNLNLWPKSSLLETCYEISQKTRFRWADQSLLNVIFSENWGQLDESWNNMKSPDRWNYAFPSKENNYHLVGFSKPWHFPPLFSFGLVRKAHRKLKRISKHTPLNFDFTRRSYLLFFIKSWFV
jgi:lipopolysaccharide biosynthesis glycosyltransferase